MISQRPSHMLSHPMRKWLERRQFHNVREAVDSYREPKKTLLIQMARSLSLDQLSRLDGYGCNSAGFEGRLSDFASKLKRQPMY